jgi:hypothetical protein
MDSARRLNLLLIVAVSTLLVSSAFGQSPSGASQSSSKKQPPVLFEYRAPGKTAGKVGELYAWESPNLPFRDQDGKDIEIPLSHINTLTLTESDGRPWCYPMPHNAEESDKEFEATISAQISSNALVQTSDGKQVKGCVGFDPNVLFLPPQVGNEPTPPFELEINKKASKADSSDVGGLDEDSKRKLVRLALGTFHRTQ